MGILSKAFRVLLRFRAREIADAILVTAIRDIDGSIGEALRFEYYRNKFKSIGRNVRIDTSVFISGAHFISIGDDVHLDKGTVLVACDPGLDLSKRDLKEVAPSDVDIQKGELRIGNSIHIGQNCAIFAYGGVRIDDKCTFSAGCRLYSLTSLPWSPSNRHERVSIMPYSDRSPSMLGPIVLHENVWLGLNCLVFPGVVLGKDTFARSNSVIIDSMQENSFVRGDPAVRVGDRYR